MICVSIGRGRHRHMIAEHKHLAEQGAQLVELRLDYINGEVNIRRLIQPSGPARWSSPAGATATAASGPGTEDAAAHCCCARPSPKASSTSTSRRTSPARSRATASTKRIVSLHDFRKTPEHLDDLHNRHDARSTPTS